MKKEKYDVIVVGFGKAGKTFAKFAGKQGKKVALIEASKSMYGGTCINIGCIPTKVLVEAGREGLSFPEAVTRKQKVVAALNEKNYKNLAEDDNITVIDGYGRFVEDKVIEVVRNEQVVSTLTGDTIVINTGASPNLLPIKGVESSFVHTSTSMMHMKETPKHLVIIGGGYISLEFASMMTNFGTKVTVLEKSDKIMPREDGDIVKEVLKDMAAAGISILTGVDIDEIREEGKEAKVVTSKGDFDADAILVAAGRHPNTKGLGLENTHIQVGQRGEIRVNSGLQTSVEGVYAVGDVKGGLQFTYISLDDFRILKSQVFGDKSRTQENRGAIPYAVFMTPVLGRVGLLYEEALQKGYQVVEHQVAVNQIPRHQINNDPRGLFKVVVDQESQAILGASLYGENAEELINSIKMAMDCKIPYTYMRDAIFTHPTMMESFNDLMNL